MIEYYAGVADTRSKKSSSRDEGKASEETQIVLTIAIVLTVTIFLIMLFHNVADCCRKDDINN